MIEKVEKVTGALGVNGLIKLEAKPISLLS